ncbi:HNH endonuclease signature motif containing protein [Vagococcus fluvialis]|nr:HNH endonuclease signature motif containing protein [Vagococcus fluvialis]UDM70695.1 HNH endonuclease [Vagococcus fluvialis]UDM82383.1 HNH endonuclease [Vagococcus fluvialis]
MLVYTKEQIDFMRENYSGKTNRELADLVNKKFGTTYTANQIKNCKRNRKITSDSYESKLFKGDKPSNVKKIGSERLQKDGYVYVKVSEGERWITKHKYLFEKHVRKLNKGEIVIFLNGDKTDFSIDNLAAVTRGELAQLNKLGYIQSDREFAIAGLNIIRIKDRLKGDEV